MDIDSDTEHTSLFFPLYYLRHLLGNCPAMRPTTGILDRTRVLDSLRKCGLLLL